MGLMLVGIGAWAIRASRRLHLHPAAEHGDHSHVHVHPPAGASHDHAHRPPDPAGRHDHRHAITLVGLAHGLVGTTTVIALVPVTLVDRVSIGIGYLLAFGLGTIVAMTTFAMLVAAAMQFAAERSVALGRHLSIWAGGAGMSIGAWWILRAISGA